MSLYKRTIWRMFEDVLDFMTPDVVRFAVYSAWLIFWAFSTPLFPNSPMGGLLWIFTMVGVPTIAYWAESAYRREREEEE